MKKALLIIACVAGYSLLEAALLLSVTVTSPSDSTPSLYLQVVIFGQLLLLPGMAALISRILYGPFQSLRRTLLILLTGPLSIIAVLGAGLLLTLAISLLSWADGVSRILFVVLLPVFVSAVLMAFVVLVHNSGRWSVRAEAARWLAERQSGTSERDRTWRARSIRFAVCLPLLVTLPIFLFLPEIWALVSHVRWPHCGALAGYRVRVPATWYISYHYDEQGDGRSGVDGLAGSGIALGANPFRYDSMAWWAVETRSTDSAMRTDYERWPPKPENILQRRTIKIASGDVECVDYWQPYALEPTPEFTSAHVDCSGPARLHTSFSGGRRNLDQFYRMLGGIAVAK